jgi:uncharacterized metal-binding protein YceD (DUF177 family)
VPILVGQIPSTGLHKVVSPTDREAQAIAQLGGLLHVRDLKADLQLIPGQGDRLRVEGRITGHVGQTCVVTLDPIDVAVDEEISLDFAPAEHVRALSTSIDEAGDDDESDRPDPPEPIEGDTIDLGKIATDALYLGLDPYPRKPGAVFELPASQDAEEDHPFAALKALKTPE